MEWLCRDEFLQRICDMMCESPENSELRRRCHRIFYRLLRHKVANMPVI